MSVEFSMSVEFAGMITRHRETRAALGVRCNDLLRRTEHRSWWLDLPAARRDVESVLADVNASHQTTLALLDLLPGRVA